MFRDWNQSTGSDDSPIASLRIAVLGMIVSALCSGCMNQRMLRGYGSYHASTGTIPLSQRAVAELPPRIEPTRQQVEAPLPLPIGTTIRSQDAELPGGWSGLTGAAENAIEVRPAAILPPPPSATQVAQFGAHSFAAATPRVRLGRPEPVANSQWLAEIVPAGIPELRDSGSPTLQIIPGGRADVTSGPAIVSNQDQAAGRSPVPLPKNRVQVVSQGSDNSTSPRQPDPDDVAPKIMNSTVSATRSDTSTSGVAGSEQGGWIWNPAGKSSPGTESAQAPVPTQPPSNVGSPDVLPSQTLPPAADQSSTVQPEAIGVPPMLPEVPAARTPSVFDRLRELYSPPKESNTSDRIRRQFRRIPDPLGLLRDSETTTDAVVPSQTADATNAAAPDSHPEIPVNSDATSFSNRLQPLIAELQDELQQWPRETTGQISDVESWRRKQTDLRLLWLISGQSADAISAIEALPPEEQEFWQALMLAMTYYRQAASEGSSRDEQLQSTADQLRAAFQHVQSLSRVSIRRAAFCSNINSFGNIDTFPTADFTTGQPVLVYVEVDNLRADRTNSGTYRSECSAVLEILRDGDEQPVETLRIQKIADESTTLRTDYYQGFELTIPSHLEPGHYSVRVRLTDLVTRRQCDATLEFNVR